MAIQPIQPPFNQPGYPEGICSRSQQIALAIVQISIRILFVGGAILMAAVALPIHFHAIVLPITAISSAFLASFFFASPFRVNRELFGPLPPLIRPAAPQALPALAAPLPEAPRGIDRVGQNCAFISLIQFLESDPQVAGWMRHLFHDDMDMAAFENFLALYDPPPQLLDDFRAYVAGQPAPIRAIPDLFNDFITQYPPAPAVTNLKETFQALRVLQQPLAQFLAAYDQARQENLPVVLADIQRLREALHRISEVIPESAHAQVDAPELMQFILNLLPNRFKLKYNETTYFDTQGLPPLHGYPDGIVQKMGEPQVHIALDITNDDPAPRLETMLRRFCDDPTSVEKASVELDPRNRYTGRKNYTYPATIRRNFDEAPPCLRIQIRRFVNEVRPSGWITWLAKKVGLSEYFPPLGSIQKKLETPIEAPDEFLITLNDGTQRRYRLASFINHWGGYGGGHYTADRIVNGQKYHMNDHRVNQIDPATWEEHLRRAYLLYYQPVQV